MSNEKLKPKGLTLSAIFKAMSMNYGENTGNISELKKLSMGNEYYSYISRQALRYEAFRKMTELYSVEEAPLTAQNDVAQFSSDANVKDHVEADLFGYMKTEGGQSAQTRPAVVRINPAVSLEPWLLDTEFGANHDFARRANANPNPFQFEQHHSLYAYTITVDLDRVGKDGDIDIEPQEKARRVAMLLDAIQFLTRDIKGRRENLSPVFVVGGVYDIKNPFFEGRLRVVYDRDSRKFNLSTELIKSAMKLRSLGTNMSVEDNTYMGLLEGFWKNEKEIKDTFGDKVSDISRFFEKLKREIDTYYGVKGDETPQN